jgi:uncharacterized protein
VLRRLATFIYDRAWWIIAAAVLVTVGFGSRLPYLQIKDTVEHFFLDGDPAVEFFHRFLETFESDEFFLVAFSTENAYDNESLAIIQRLTEELEKLDNIEQVISLSNVQDIRAAGDDIEVAPLIGALPLTPAAQKIVVERAAQNPLIVGSVVAPDAKAAAVFCRIARLADDPQYRKDMTAAVYALMQEIIPPGTTAFAAGGPIFYTEYIHHVEKDLSTFTPLTTVLLALLMILIYRRWRAVWLPLACILVALVWTLGMLQVTGRSLNLVTNIIPPLILVIGLAVIVHVLNRYEEEYRRLGEKRLALIEAITHLFHPCFLTSLTTAVGFASLAISRIKPIRETGMLAAFGVMMTFVISITVAPAILSRLAAPVPPARRAARHDWIDRALALCTRLVITRPKTIVGVSVVFTLIALAGMTQLTVETNLIEYFRTDSQIRRAYDYLQENISGANALELFVETDAEDGLLEPAVLRAMETMQRELEKSSRITATQSLADLVKALSRALHGDDPAFYRIPDTRAEIAQLLLLLSLSDDRGGLDMFTDLNYRRGRITSRMTTIPSERLRDLLVQWQAFADRTFPPGVRVAPTGEVVLYVDMEKELVQGQLKGFGIAIVIIILCVIGLFWSWRVGVLSIYPNVMPVAMTLGLMGLVGIPINLATCMIPSIAIGIAVDDTIHLLSRFRAAYRRRGHTDVEGAISEAVATTGRAMVVTSVVLFGGFLVLLASQFQPNLYFGVLTALTMVWALAADLLTVPAMLVLLKPKSF